MIESFNQLEAAFEALLAADPATVPENRRADLASRMGTLRHRMSHHLDRLRKKMKPKTHEYERLRKFTLEEGFALLDSGEPNMVINNEWVTTSPSLRLQTFMIKGVECAFPRCSLKGSFFAAERSFNPRTDQIPKAPEYRQYAKYHLNLYGIDPSGAEVLFTHDHILAQSLGGTDDLSNTQTMCNPHNNLKSKRESLIAQLRQLEVETHCHRCNGTTIVLCAPKEGEGHVTVVPCPDCQPAPA